ncbi:aspartyl protease family protein [Chryseobacterium phosphatilyticum]|nr:aspartyl protease family protein [Chryseobacterium phosphatilyticum]
MFTQSFIKKSFVTASVFLYSSVALAQKTPLQILPSGHMLVEAEIEGKKGNFIFDTGAGINLLLGNFYKNLGQKETYNYLTAFRATGEKITVPLFKSKEITLNGKKFKDTWYATYDTEIKGIDGLISLSMLYDTEFIIDYTTKELIFPKEKLKSNKVMDIQLSTNADQSLDISTYILLNNTYKINVLLDSGSGNDSFWFSDRLISTLGLKKENLKLLEQKSEFNPDLITKFYVGNIPSVSTSFATVEKPKVSFVEGLIYEGKTSINWLGKKLGFNLKEKKIYILD